MFVLMRVSLTSELNKMKSLHSGSDFVVKSEERKYSCSNHVYILPIFLRFIAIAA